MSPGLLASTWTNRGETPLVYLHFRVRIYMSFVLYLVVQLGASNTFLRAL
jgi:hypothetical protein